MKQLGQNIQGNSLVLLKKLALNIDKNVVMATPVDTGRARANWQVQINGPAQGELEKEDPSGAVTIAMGQTAIMGVQHGQAIHITNNLPYVVYLNDGTSTQAPLHFVEESIAAAMQSIKNYRLLKDL
jgi:hypothetical protein